MKPNLRRAPLSIIAVLLLAVAVTHAQELFQIPYDRGQDVQPVFEGWRKTADGSYDMLFGYYNRNRQETLDVPVGADNMFEPGPVDQGQPTHFLTRRQMFLFSVRVPADWGKKDLVWTLRTRGKTQKAYGSLMPVWEVDDELIVKNKGTAAFRLDLIKNDRRPSLQVTTVPTVALPASATLAATIQDDGLPAPRRAAARRSGGSGEGEPATSEDAFGPVRESGLTLTWAKYRGPGRVTFNPPGPTIPVTIGTTTVTASFSEPGVYVLHALASDGLLDVEQRVTVTVR